MRTIIKVRNVEIGAGVPKICVPIVGITKEEIITEAKSFESIPVDVVEWRVDWFENVFEFDKVLDVLKELRKALGETPAPISTFLTFTIFIIHLLLTFKNASAILPEAISAGGLTPS